jgi:hypothetical protein
MQEQGVRESHMVTLCMQVELGTKEVPYGGDQF